MSLKVELPLYTATKIWSQISSIYETGYGEANAHADGDFRHCNYLWHLTWQDVGFLKEAFKSAYKNVDDSTDLEMRRIKDESSSDWVMPQPETAEDVVVQPKKKQRTDEALQTEPITYPNPHATVKGTWEKSKTGDGNWHRYPNIDSSWDPHHECYMPNWYWNDENVMWNDEGKYKGCTMSRSDYDYWKANPHKDWKKYCSNLVERQAVESERDCSNLAEDTPQLPPVQYESGTPNAPWEQDMQT
jgi:hypothetical protein